MHAPTRGRRPASQPLDPAGHSIALHQQQNEASRVWEQSWPHCTAAHTLHGVALRSAHAVSSPPALCWRRRSLLLLIVVVVAVFVLVNTSLPISAADLPIHPVGHHGARSTASARRDDACQDAPIDINEAILPRSCEKGLLSFPSSFAASGGPLPTAEQTSLARRTMLVSAASASLLLSITSRCANRPIHGQCLPCCVVVSNNTCYSCNSAQILEPSLVDSGSHHLLAKLIRFPASSHHCVSRHSRLVSNQPCLFHPATSQDTHASLQFWCADLRPMSSFKMGVPALVPQSKQTTCQYSIRYHVDNHGP